MSRRWADVSACVVTWARRRPWCFTHGRYFGVCGIPDTLVTRIEWVYL